MRHLRTLGEPCQECVRERDLRGHQAARARRPKQRLAPEPLLAFAAGQQHRLRAKDSSLAVLARLRSGRQRWVNRDTVDRVAFDLGSHPAIIYGEEW